MLEAQYIKQSRNEDNLFFCNVKTISNSMESSIALCILHLWR